MVIFIFPYSSYMIVNDMNCLFSESDLSLLFCDGDFCCCCCFCC